MALDLSNGRNLEQLALKGLTGQIRVIGQSAGPASVIFVNENENGEKRVNNEFVNEN